MANVDRTDMYEIQEYWLENIAPKYFNLSDLSLNRAGLFGYINEIEAHSSEQIVNENSILYNELFFKKATLPESIYAYASQYNVANTSATPAIMSFALTISEDILIENSFREGSNTYFIIDSDSEIIVEDEIVYSVDYDIKISIRKNEDGNYSYTAKYDVDNIGNPISSITSTSNPYLKLIKIKFAGKNYVVIYVTAHQVSKTETNKKIYSENLIDYFCFDISSESEDQIADFSVFYREDDRHDFEPIQKILIDKQAMDEKFCYYQFKDNNNEQIVNISFSTISRYFQPKFNSELKFVFYNTKGKDGNFEYNGKNVTIELHSKKYDYKSVIMTVQSIGNSAGGRNALSYEEIKNKVSLLASTCDVLGTEIDLNKYFTNLETESKMKFIDKEDDAKRRLYGAYCMYNDFNNNIIPTNTLDIDIQEDEFDLVEESTKRYVIKAGDEFIYQSNSRVLKKVNKNESLLFDPKFLYKLPFTMIINRDQFFVSYYLTSINNTYTVDYFNINEDLYINFMMYSVNIKRNATISDTYEITFCLEPATDDTDILFATFKKDEQQNDVFVEDNKNMIVKGLIYDENHSISHYFDCEMIGAVTMTSSESIDIDGDGISNKSDLASSVKYYFRAQIKTDDYISSYSHLRTTDGVVYANDFNKENPLIPATELAIQFAVFIKNEDDYNTDYDNFHTHIQGIEGYSMTNTFNIPERVSLITDMNRMMYSTVLYKYNEENDLFYRIKEVPLIKSEYLNIKQYANSFYKSFFTDYNLLKENLNKITNGFDISIKFYNTYGKSFYYYVDEKKTNTLDQVNLVLALRIKLNPNKLSDTLLKDDIRKSIQKYVENINEDRDLNLYISNIITMLEDTYHDIISCKFKYLNNYNADIQSVEKNFPTNSYTDRSRLAAFVPEYLNINKTFIDYLNTETSVLIEFV